MHTRSNIALGILFLATGFFVTDNRFAVAFSSSAAVINTPKSRTSKKFYNNGESSQFTTFSKEEQGRTSSHSSHTPPDPFEIWGKMRLGLGTGAGSNPDGVFWVGGGAMYEVYSGKILAIFEGFDIGKGVQITDNHIRQLSRKIFWFRDPESNDILTQYEGKPVNPIVYDSQVIDYHRVSDGSITYSVEASLRVLKDALPKMKITSHMAGPQQMMINIPVFLDIPMPNNDNAAGGGGRYQAWEFYDYNVDTTFSKNKPPTAVWCRQGSVPPFNMDSKAVLRFSGYRVETYNDLPERMRVEVERAYPHFQEPPKDTEDAILQVDRKR